MTTSSGKPHPSATPEQEEYVHIGTRPLLLQTLPLPGSIVIDVGCGDGRLARMMADDGNAAQVVGIECSPRQLAKARAFPPHDRVTIVDAVAQALPLDDASADIVVFFNSLHHIPLSVMDTAFSEVTRVLRPGGFVYINEPVAEGPFFTLCQQVDDETHVRAQAQDAITRAVRPRFKTGLKIAKEQLFVHPVKLPSFDAFRERITSANAERDAIFDRLTPTLTELFERLAKRDENGSYVFEQISHMTLLKKE